MPSNKLDRGAGLGGGDEAEQIPFDEESKTHSGAKIGQLRRLCVIMTS